MSVNDTFTLNGGTFNAPSGTLNFANNVTVGAAATFNNNGGTISFVGGSNFFLVLPAKPQPEQSDSEQGGGSGVFLIVWEQYRQQSG